MELTKRIQGLKTEFSKEIGTFKKTQTEMRMELKNPITLLENPNKSLTSRMNQVEDRISGLKDKAEDLDNKSKGWLTRSRNKFHLSFIYKKT